MIRSFLLHLFFTIPILGVSYAGYSNPVQFADSIEIVFKDTMHVRGKVMDEKGMPLKAIAVTTRGYYSTLVYASTDDQGNFLLKNVQPNDTIFFKSANRSAKIYPEGSRILNMVLPEETRERWIRSTVIAKRERPKEVKNSIVKFENWFGFPIYESWAEPVGGVSKLNKDLKSNLTYPEKARIANIEGMVKIEFVIDREGKPTEFKTIQGLGYGCEEAVIKVLKMKKWRPAHSNGSNSPMTNSVNVLFKLQDF